ncbi:hypothetical protein ABEB36_006211 [Hypothenemus hampei]|uniref:Uncharacterized protein n=1 Tax=Hypothenemus hampei TaxID=57062 RepID=A0ABD1ETP9_HYPHA
MMCDLNRQKELLKNISYAADSTWSTKPCLYQLTNLNLYLKACHLRDQTNKWSLVYPRTVKDSIPHSKLAKYASYKYDEARELSYSPMKIDFDKFYPPLDKNDVKEPWMLDEINDLYFEFLSYNDGCLENGQCTTEPSLGHSRNVIYQSPFMDAMGFEQVALKMKIESNNIKQIWSTENCFYYNYPLKPGPNVLDVFLYKSPLGHIFVPLQEKTQATKEHSLDLFKNDKYIELPRNRFKKLAKIVKEQNGSILEKQSNKACSKTITSQEPAQKKRLYSAVVQGVPETTTALPRKATAFAISKKATVSLKKNDHDYSDARKATNSFLNQYYQQQEQPQTSHPHFLPKNMLAIIPNYQHQTHYFAQNIFTPRLYSNNSLAFNLKQSYYPLFFHNHYTPSPLVNYQQSRATTTRFPSYHLVLPPPQQLVIPSVTYRRPRMRRPVYNPRVAPSAIPNNLMAQSNQQYYNRTFKVRLNDKLNQQDDYLHHNMANVASSAINTVWDDQEQFVPVTSVPSDDLELQALEQYTPSDTNVFQELERQAIEQYDNSAYLPSNSAETPENWIDPPKNLYDVDGLIGGCFSLVKSFGVQCQFHVKQ